MVIVSQDKEKITEDINLNIAFASNYKDYLIYNMKMPAFNLGIYKSKERAKEVLKEIVQMYRMNGNCVVYEMPKE